MIKSYVNDRQFSVVTNSDLDWRSTDVLYVLSSEERDCGIQYVDTNKVQEQLVTVDPTSLGRRELT